MKTIHETLNPGGVTARVRAEVMPEWIPVPAPAVEPELLQTVKEGGRTTWHFRLDDRTAERLGIMPLASLVLGTGIPGDRIVAVRWEVRSAGRYRRFSPYSAILCTPWTWPLRRDEAMQYPGRVLMDHLEAELGDDE
jgi:hypothetical protein